MHGGHHHHAHAAAAALAAHLQQHNHHHHHAHAAAAAAQVGNRGDHDLVEDANVVKVKVVAAEDLYVDESKEVLRVFKGQSVEFRIPKSIRLVKLKKRYCEEYNLHLDEDGSNRCGVQFKFGNRTIQDHDTCGTLCLATNDTIKVTHTPEFHCYLHATSNDSQRNTLQSDMRRLYNQAMRGESDSTDVTFVVGGERISAHRLILSARCEKMRAMFSSTFSGCSEQKTGEVAILDHDPLTFKLMLEWIYCDTVETPASAEGCLQLLALAEEMLLFPLKGLCEVVLMGFINKHNAVSLFICSDRYNVEFLKLKCKQYIMDNYDAMLADEPDFEKELCKVPELLVELTRSALSREDDNRYVSQSALGSPSGADSRGSKRRRSSRA